MQKKLPIVLEREPLVDAVFEVRLKGTQPLGDILPGFLMAELKPKPTVTRLPAAEIPRPMRAADPGLQFAPTQRIDWSRFFISVGDQNIVISCKLPYPKWPNFKKAILEILQHIGKAEIEGEVERYSLKYVNLIEAPTPAEQVKKIRTKIQLGDIEVLDDHFSLQVHRQEGDILHILSIVTSAHAQLPDGRQISGAIVDVDSIQVINVPSFHTFLATLENGLERIRQENKAKFFSCVTEAAIAEMGPRYE